MTTELLKLILLTLSTASPASNQKHDIKQVILWYFEGAKQGDTTLIEKAFHKDAKLKHIKIDGELYEADLNHFIQYLKENGGMPVIETSILNIDLTETSASAKVLFVFKDFIYVDYLNLLRIKNQWKIVDKVYIKRQLNE